MAISVCLWKNVYSDSLPIFQSGCLLLLLLLSCMSSLHILVINPLSDIWLTNAFFSSIGCLFIYWLLSFMCRNFLVWCSPICLFFFLFPLLKEPEQKRHCQDWWQRMDCLCFLQGILCLKGLYSRSYTQVFNPFWVNCCVWYNLVSFFTLQLFSLSSTIYGRYFPFSIVCSWLLCVKLVVYTWVALFMGCKHYYIDLSVLFCECYAVLITIA